MLTLHYAPGTIAIAVALTLEEAALVFTPVKLDFRAGEQTSGAYRSLNPKGRVPTLVTEAGTALTETGALLEYIAARAPEAGLIPEDIEAAAHMRGAMYYLASTMHVAHAHKLRGHRWADQEASFEDMRAKVPQTMAECAAYLEANGLRGDFVCGDRLSLADPYLFVVLGWLAGDGVALDDYPRLAAFVARMNDRPALHRLREKGLVA